MVSQRNIYVSNWKEGVNPTMISNKILTYGLVGLGALALYKVYMSSDKQLDNKNATFLERLLYSKTSIIETKEDSTVSIIKKPFVERFNIRSMT